MPTFNGGASQTAEASFTNPYDSILRNHAQNLFDGTMEALDNNRNTDKENRLTQRANITNDLLAQIQSGNLTDLGSLPVGNYDTTALVKSLADKAVRDEAERYHRASIATQRYGINTRAATQRYGIDKRATASASRLAAKTAAANKLKADQKAALEGLAYRKIDELSSNMVGEGTPDQLAEAQRLSDYITALGKDDVTGIAHFGGDPIGAPKTVPSTYNPKKDNRESMRIMNALHNSNLKDPNVVANYWSSQDGIKAKAVQQKILDSVANTKRTAVSRAARGRALSTGTPRKVTPKEGVAQVKKELKKVPLGSKEYKKLSAELKDFEYAKDFFAFEKKRAGAGTNTEDAILRLYQRINGM